MKTLEKQSSTEPKHYLTGDEADPISLKQAAQWTRNYRERYPGETISYFFGIGIIQQILQQEGCIGLRVYYANSQPLNGWQKFIISISNFLVNVVAKSTGEKHLIVVGAEKSGADQIPGEHDMLLDERHNGKEKTHGQEKTMSAYSSTAETKGTRQYVIAEQATPCPGSPTCPKNPLTEEKE